MPFVDVNGLRMHVIDEGEGPALVFLHGFPLDHSMWDAQRREFRSTHRVLIPDLRGFGRSVSQDDVVTMDQFADDVVAMLDAVGISDPVTLCGLSMGGYIAFALMRRAADRVGRLVLCDTRALPDTPEAAENRRKVAEKVLVDGPRVLTEAMLPKLFGPQTNEEQPQVVDAVRHVMMASSSRAIAAAQRGMAGRPDSTPGLKEITVPTLVIVGEHDAISPADEMRQFAVAIPNATVQVIPDAGHMAPMEDPAAVNAAIREWMSR